jgi:hypothetical protein
MVVRQEKTATFRDVCGSPDKIAEESTRGLMGTIGRGLSMRHRHCRLQMQN